jgi:hypothetical protein
MKTEERLSRAGWQFVEPYADLVIMKRGVERMLFNEKTDEIYMVYGDGIKTYKPIGIEIELLCEKPVK